MRCTTSTHAHGQRRYCMQATQGPSMAIVAVNDVSARGGGGPAT